MMGTRFSIRKIAAAALLCTMTLIAGSCGHKESGRVVKLLDEGWKFTRADNMGFAAADYNDAYRSVGSGNQHKDHHVVEFL